MSANNNAPNGLKERAEQWVNARIEEDDPFFWRGELAVGYMAGYRAALRDAQDIIASSYSSNHVANYHHLSAWLNARIQEVAKDENVTEVIQKELEKE